MFNTIIVGIDGRPQDAEALALARQLGAPGAEIIAACIAVPPRGEWLAGTPETDAGRLQIAEDIVDEFADGRRQLEALATPGPSVGVGLRAAALGAGADLIVVASSRRGVLGRVIAGDDIREILCEAPCTVAVAPVGRTETGALHSIVVGYDGTSESDLALAHAAAFGQRDGARVNVVIVVEPLVAGSAMSGVYAGDAIEDEYQRARTSLDRVAATYELKGVIATGNPASELAGASHGADLLAIGFHDRSRLDRLLSGDTGTALLHRSTAALLLCPTAPAARHVADALDDAVPAADAGA